MKMCRACRTEKPFADFHADKANKDGYRRYCKSCYRERYQAKQNAARRTDAARERRRTWNKTRVLGDAYRERQRRHQAMRRASYPEQERAKRATSRAIQSGAIVRPNLCEQCGHSPEPNRAGKPTIHAHHHDYSKPLEVRWLCALCHAREHRALADPASAEDGR